MSHDSHLPPQSQSFPPPLMGEPVRQPTWHKTIGIIAIVFGLGGIGTFLLNFVFTKALSKVKIPGAEELHDLTTLMERHHFAATVLPLLHMILGVLLLTGGILLLRRMPVARMLLIAFAVLKIGWAVAQFKPNMDMQRDLQALQLKSLEKDAKTAEIAGAMSGAMEGMAVGVMVLGFIWYCALPVFLLIWFFRRKVKEDIAAWRTPITF